MLFIRLLIALQLVKSFILQDYFISYKRSLLFFLSDNDHVSCQFTDYY